MRKAMYLGVLVGVLTICVVWLVGCEKGKIAKPSVPQKDVVAMVNDQVITMQDVDAKISKLPAYYQQILQGRKKELVDDMVLEVLLYEEAKKRGIDKDKEVKEMLEDAHKKILISKLVKDEVETKTTVSDKDAEEYYNSHKEEFMIPERLKASHILVKTEEEAKAVLDELAKGKSFEELAKEKSIDSSAKRGGDVGYFTKGQMTPEFEAAAYKLEIGQISPVVKTQFGYHIIKLTDKKPAEMQELKDASARIKNTLLTNKRQAAFNKLISGLREKAKISINEAALTVEQKKEVPAAQQQVQMPVAPAPEPKKAESTNQ